MAYEEEIREGFIRQRRNLMIMSFVMLLSELTDLNITKISAFGNEAAVSNPMLINAAMWVLLIYWLVRYYQYFHETKDTGFLANFREKRKRMLKHLVAHFTYRAPKFKASLPVKDGKKLRPFHYDFKIFDDRLFMVRGVLQFVISDHPEKGGSVDQEEFRYGFWKLVFPSILSATDVLVRTRYFSEYLLPFLLFLLPLVFSSESAQGWLQHLVSSRI